MLVKVQDLGASAQVQTLGQDNEEGDTSITLRLTLPHKSEWFFLLKTSYNNHSAMVLTGDGSLLLQLGDGASERRREHGQRIYHTTRMQRTLSALTDAQTKAHEFPIEKYDSSAARVSATSTTATAVFTLIFWF